MCMNLIMSLCFDIVISCITLQSLWFSIVQTQLHYICLTGNFRKGVVRLYWVAKWVAAWKRLKTTGVTQSAASAKSILLDQCRIDRFVAASFVWSMTATETSAIVICMTSASRTCFCFLADARVEIVSVNNSAININFYPVTTTNVDNFTVTVTEQSGRQRSRSKFILQTSF